VNTSFVDPFISASCARHYNPHMNVNVTHVRYCVEYLYSPVTMRLELFVRYCVEYLYSQVTMGLELYLAV
jgi:hypothetical protein